MTPASLAGTQLLDDARFGAFQLRTILICAFVALLDGFDTQAIAFAAPVMARAWGIDISTFGAVFAAGLLGGLLGAVVIGRLADRRGRKFAMIGALAIMAVGSLATPFLNDRVMLIVARLVAGFGLGGALPCAIALTTEYAPARLRASITTAMFCAFPFGAVLGAILSGPLLDAGNWQALFWIGGLAPLLTIPLVARWVPESLGWLQQNGRHAAAAVIAAKLGVDIGSAPATPDKPTAAVARGLTAVVADGRLGMTVRLGVAFFISLLLVYLLVNWVPTLAVQAGQGARSGAHATALLNITGIAGGLGIAWIGDRTSTTRVVALAYIAGGIACGLIALLSGAASPVLLLCATAGLLCIGAQMCLVSIAAATYPLQLRAGAIGLLMAIGRIGAISGPLLGGALIGGDHGFARLAWVVAAGSILAAAALWQPRRV